MGATGEPAAAGFTRIVCAVGTMSGQGVAYLMAIVNALLYCLVVFGVSLSNEQQAAIVGLVNALLVAAIHGSSSWARSTKAAG